MAAIKIEKGEAQLFRRALMDEARFSAHQFDERSELEDGDGWREAQAIAQELALADGEIEITGSSRTLAGAVSWVIFELETELGEMVDVESFDRIRDKALEIARWAELGAEIKEGARA